jgi:hypothetical protein
MAMGPRDRARAEFDEIDRDADRDGQRQRQRDERGDERSRNRPRRAIDVGHGGSMSCW